MDRPEDDAMFLANYFRLINPHKFFRSYTFWFTADATVRGEPQCVENTLKYFAETEGVR